MAWAKALIGCNMQARSWPGAHKAQVRDQLVYVLTRCSTPGTAGEEDKPMDFTLKRAPAGHQDVMKCCASALTVHAPQPEQLEPLQSLVVT